MPTVYIAPTAQGSADGTSAANAYAYSSLSSAETDAGNGGTILFLDGTYSFTGDKTWDSGGFADMTYKSLNDQGAYLFGTSIRRLTIGSSTTTTMKIEGFQQANIHWYGNASTTFTINKIRHADTVSGTRGGLGIFVPLNSNANAITNSSFVIDYSSSDRLFHSAGGTSLTSCSFFLKCSNVSANGITSFGGSPSSSSNTIFMSDNSSAIDASVIDSSTCTNCCIFQMDSGDSSGGTNNVFADPQFVDAPNSDLRLRPSSPCINAGTAS